MGLPGTPLAGADNTVCERPTTQTEQSPSEPWIAGIPLPLDLSALDLSAIWGKLIDT
jgi:hypothetical protein